MKKAFTLIELLIAASIFVIVMVLTTAIFSMAASYNGKLTEMRRTSLDGRKIGEQLSRDIRLANGSLTDFYISDSTKRLNVGEVTFFNCLDSQNNMADTGCSLNTNSLVPVAPAVITPLGFQTEVDAVKASKNNSPAGSSTGRNSNVLLILQKDQKKAILYYSRNYYNSDYYNIFRKEVTYTSNMNLNGSFGVPYAGYATWPVTGGTPATGWTELNDNDSFEVGFAGYGPNKTLKNQQPYVEFGLRSQTWNYDTVQVNSRAQFDLKTTVETRDYN